MIEKSATKQFVVRYFEEIIHQYNAVWFHGSLYKLIGEKNNSNPSLDANGTLEWTRRCNDRISLKRLIETTLTSTNVIFLNWSTIYSKIFFVY